MNEPYLPQNQPNMNQHTHKFPVNSHQNKAAHLNYIRSTINSPSSFTIWSAECKMESDPKVLRPADSPIPTNLDIISEQLLDSKHLNSYNIS